MAKAGDSFDFKLTGNRDVPFLGYDSTQDPTNLSAQYLVGGSKNVYLNNNGNVSVRFGLKRLGAADATEDGVVSSYEWRTNLGTEAPIRVLQSGKFQVLQGTTWYTIDTFDSSQFSFATWWDATAQQDLLLMVNGDETIKSWTGGTATVLSSTATTITKNGVQTWSEAGFTRSGYYTIASLGSITVDGSNFTAGQTVYLSSDSVIQPGVATVNTVGGSGEITSLTLVDGGSFTANPVGIVIYGTTAPDNAAVDVTFTPFGKTVVIDGTEYSYTGGEDTTTLTGVTPNATGITPGAIAIQKIVSFSGLPNPNDTQSNAYSQRLGTWSNDFILVLANQLIVFSLASRVIYLSADTNYLDFSNGGDRISGDPDFIVLDNFPNAAAVRTGSAFVSAGDEDWYKVTPNTPAPVAVPLATGGGDGYVITAVEKQPGSAGTACLGFNFVDTIGDSVVYLSQDHQIRLLGTERNLYQVKYTSLTQQVRTEFFNTDFTGGALRMIGEFIYLTAPESGQAFLYQTRDELDNVSNVTAKRIWHPPQEWGASRIAVISGLIYAHSSSNPQIYQVWDTNQWHDDSVQDEPSPYECIARFAYQDNGAKTGLLNFNRGYYEGYMAPNSALTARVRFDYLGGTRNQGQDSLNDEVISSLTLAPTLFIGESPQELGVWQVGTQQIGTDSDSLKAYPKFRFIQDIESVDVFEYQLELYSYEADSRWEIKCLGVNAAKSINNPVFLTRATI